MHRNLGTSEVMPHPGREDQGDTRERGNPTLVRLISPGAWKVAASKNPRLEITLVPEGKNHRAMLVERLVLQGVKTFRAEYKPDNQSPMEDV